MPHRSWILAVISSLSLEYVVAFGIATDLANRQMLLKPVTRLGRRPRLSSNSCLWGSPDTSSEESSSDDDSQLWKQHQFEKLQQIESRLKGIKEAQLEQESTYQARLEKILEDMGKREKELLEKIDFFANQLEQYRYDSQKALFAAREASKQKELQLKDEIRVLRERVNELDWQRSQSNEKMQALKHQRDALKEEFERLKREYRNNVEELKLQWAAAQLKAEDLETRNKKIRKETELETERRVQEAEKKSRKERTRIHNEYAIQLADIERQLRNMEEEARTKSQLIEELEAERLSLRALVSRSRDIISKRATTGLKRYLRKESRGFTYLC